jgi:UTP--glucose-1-phosphate uridylyltransferase
MTSKIEKMQEEINKLSYTIKDEDARDTFQSDMKPFLSLFERYCETKNSIGSKIEWSKISSVEDKLIDYSKIIENGENFDNIKELLNKLVVIKLNGGLGTTMGCKGIFLKII